jgi:membrane-associated phospholipid phosphatase
MNLLEREAQHVKNLSPRGVRLFISGRVLLAFGLGSLLALYVPQRAIHLAWPLVGLGILLIVVAILGFTQPPKSQS